MKTILLADDEPHLRLLVRTTLEGAGVRVLEEADGEAALATARAVKPDLLILDLMMPGLSGLEVAAALHDDPRLGDPPVIMLTARNQSTDRERCYRAGAVAYLAKPFSPLELVHQVELALGTL